GTRPADGKVRILATTPGNESFIDINGNGTYDYGIDIFSIGDPDSSACNLNVPIPSAAGASSSCDDLGEAFTDRNHNGVYDLGVDTFIDFDSNGQRTEGNGIYDGILCAAGSTNCTRNTVTVREDLMLVMSDGVPAVNIDNL